MQAKYLEALGSIHLNARRYPQAKEHFTRANDIWHQENTPDKWRSQSEVAIAMAVCQEPRSEWEPLFQEALEHQEIELGSDHRDTAITLGYYGVALGEYNEYSRATELIKRAYESQQKTSANDVMMAIDCCLNIGKMCMFQSNYIEAAKWLEQGYEQSCLVFGPDYKSSLMLRNHLAIVYGVHSRYEDCLNMLLESYNSSVRTFGPDHIDTWQVLSKSVTVYCSLGQYDQMERVLTRNGTSNVHLGKLYYFREEYERAAPLIEMAYRELFAKKNFLVFHTIYDLYHLKLKTHGLDTLEDLAAYEKILEDSSCTDETWKAHPCRGCFVLVRGRRFVCAECPTDSRWYCAPCVCATSTIHPRTKTAVVVQGVRLTATNTTLTIAKNEFNRPARSSRAVLFHKAPKKPQVDFAGLKSTRNLLRLALPGVKLSDQTAKASSIYTKRTTVAEYTPPKRVLIAVPKLPSEPEPGAVFVWLYTTDSSIYDCL
ncbi:hypothetical protein Ae201684P_016703 [Aphanomyces euteiches]|nr:hypothetical protein Ae201684P_016703 [Aphanomyces euteiches]